MGWIQNDLLHLDQLHSPKAWLQSEYVERKEGAEEEEKLIQLNTSSKSNTTSSSTGKRTSCLFLEAA